MNTEHYPPESRGLPPVRLMNNGQPVNTPGVSLPKIFRSGPQILDVRNQNEEFSPRTAATRRAYSTPDEHERLFGGPKAYFKESTNSELSRLQVNTVRQLQRALQQKILQTTRPGGLTAAFYRMATQRVMTDPHGRPQVAVGVDDLRRAVAGFNLSASDELVIQLHCVLDTDHDGTLW